MEKECRLKTNSKIELIINKAINFLAPYFEINVNNERLGEIDFPKVCIETKAHYNHINNIIFLPGYTKEGNFQVGHEVGHWFHDVINPKVAGIRDYESAEQYQSFVLLTESVAFYSQIIYVNRKDIIRNPKFNLLELAKMGFDEAKLREQCLVEFFWKLVNEGRDKNAIHN